MPFPKLTPLQSRFAASLAASLILLVIYFSLTNPQFAYAANVDSIVHEDHNHRRLLDLLAQGDGTEDFNWEGEQDGEAELYEPEFAVFDRGIIGRADDMVVTLANNAPGILNIDAGTVQYWKFPNATLQGPFASETPTLPSSVYLRIRDDGADFGDHESEEWLDEEGHGHNKELERRQTTALEPRILYITLNTCLQPLSHSNGGMPPPQLEVYVSQSPSNKRPGPGNYDPNMQFIADSGFANVTLNASADVYIGVSAPSTPGFSGGYNYQIAASIDAQYHSYNATNTSLYLVDSDSNSALLITNVLTTASSNESVYSEWMSIAPPFDLFAHNINDTSIQGLEKSYCGLSHNAQIAARKNGQSTQDVDGSMTKRGLDQQPKEQFYVKNLNGSSSYSGFLGLQLNSTAGSSNVPGGGGKVWTALNFTTKSGKFAFHYHMKYLRANPAFADGNCQLIYDLSFCREVAYAVPSNPKTYPNVTSLTNFYDSNAQTYYKNFSYSLQQIACDTTSSAQYSLVRNCSQCDQAYQQWLCAVTIPRCEDFSSTNAFLQPRNIAHSFINGTNLSSTNPDNNSSNMNAFYANRSRNGLIDSMIQPGPYKEILPCRDLCYSLVQSCPAALGFACPLVGHGLNRSYGIGDGVRDAFGDITCSYPGVAYYLSEGIYGFSSGNLLVAAATATTLWALLG
ncbi:MAG: stretch-activated cation channel mid1 [Pycnora praestabilis]|nr:MAG: stretch-activated cation channel mid1 [Pycnora praestabilis]